MLETHAETLVALHKQGGVECGTAHHTTDITAMWCHLFCSTCTIPIMTASF